MPRNLRLMFLAVALVASGCGASDEPSRSVETAQVAAAASEPSVAAAPALVTGRCRATVDLPEAFPADLPLPDGFGFQGGGGGHGGYWELVGCVAHEGAESSLGALLAELEGDGWRRDHAQLSPIDGDAAFRLVDGGRFYDLQVVGEPANGIAHLKIGLMLAG